MLAYEQALLDTRRREVLAEQHNLRKPAPCMYMCVSANVCARKCISVDTFFAARAFVAMRENRSRPRTFAEQHTKVVGMTNIAAHALRKRKPSGTGGIIRRRRFERNNRYIRLSDDGRLRVTVAYLTDRVAILISSTPQAVKS